MVIGERLEYFNKRIAEYEKVKKELAEELSKDFTPFVEAVLREHNFQYIVIRGFVPYFNDGDTCEFGLYMDLVYGEGVDSVREAFDAPFANLEPLNGYERDKEKTKLASEIEEIFNGLSSLLETAFGDGWEIIAAIDDNDKFHFLNQEYTDHD
jgi:hypothetical protein